MLRPFFQLLLSKAALAELFGTFMLVLVGCGAAVLAADYQILNHLQVSLAFGLIVFLMILLLGKLSGAHINPAVSISFYLQGKISKNQLFQYIIYQITGALIACVLLNSWAPENSSLGSSLSDMHYIQTFAWEFFLSLALMLGILIAVKYFSKIWQIALIVGAIVALDAYIGGPFTGASMNPARSLGPALISNNLNQIWVYILAPILGCVISLPLFKIISSNEKNFSSLYR